MLLVKWQITTWRRLCEVVVNDALLGISETQFCKTVVGRRSAKPDLCRATFAQQRCSRRHVERKAGVAAFRSTNRYCRWLGNRIPPARNRCPIEIQKMKIATKSQIEILLPELKPNKFTNAHCYYVRPTIGNTYNSNC